MSNDFSITRIFVGPHVIFLFQIVFQTLNGCLCFSVVEALWFFLFLGVSLCTWLGNVSSHFSQSLNNFAFFLVLLVFSRYFLCQIWKRKFSFLQFQTDFSYRFGHFLSTFLRVSFRNISSFFLFPDWLFLTDSLVLQCLMSHRLLFHVSWNLFYILVLFTTYIWIY